jgi:hypothetical protein
MVFIILTSRPAMGEAMAPMLKRVQSIDAALLPIEQAESQSESDIGGIGCLLDEAAEDPPH